MRKNNTDIPWLKIKKEYLEGVKPCVLAKKYKTTSNTIRSKASKENWKKEKNAISNNVQQNVEGRINSLTNKAFNALEQVLDDPNAKHQDKVAAARAVIDVSGLKKENNTNTNKNFNINTPVDEETVNSVIEKLKNF